MRIPDWAMKAGTLTIPLLAGWVLKVQVDLAVLQQPSADVALLRQELKTLNESVTKLAGTMEDYVRTSRADEKDQHDEIQANHDLLLTHSH